MLGTTIQSTVSLVLVEQPKPHNSSVHPRRWYPRISSSLLTPRIPFMRVRIVVIPSNGVICASCQHYPVHLLERITSFMGFGDICDSACTRREASANQPGTQQVPSK